MKGYINLIFIIKKLNLLYCYLEKHWLWHYTNILKTNINMSKQMFYLKKKKNLEISIGNVFKRDQNRISKTRIIQHKTLI